MYTKTMKPEIKKPINVRLEKEIKTKAKKIGHGNLTEGIRIAVRAYKKGK